MNDTTANPSENNATTGYTLRLRQAKQWHDSAILRPDIIGQWPIQKLQEKLGDTFEISGTQGPTLTLQGLNTLPGLGAHMASGALVIQGDAGDDLGAAMTGGVIHVHGSAGNNVGGPALGQYDSNNDSNNKGDARRGMNGGTIVVHGNAADYPGLRMRRGFIAIDGHAGKSPGYRMLAGTIVIAKGQLDNPGIEMQRGTIVSLSPQSDEQSQERFATDSVFETQSLSIIGLLLTQLKSLGLEVSDSMRQGKWRLLSGDRLEIGKGELWQWTH